MAENADWVAQNLQRQRRMLEEKQRSKRTCTSGVLSTAVPRATSASLTSSLLFESEPPAPTLIDVRGMTPPPPAAEEHYVNDDLTSKMERTDLTYLGSDDDDVALSSDLQVNPWDKEGIEEHTLPMEEEPDWDFIQGNVETFIQQPATRNCLYKCAITRDKKGMDKGMFPIYYLHLESYNEKKKKIFLLAARKRKKSATANYLISTDPTDLGRAGGAFVGKVRSNAMGTAFNMYDNGKNPKKVNDKATDDCRQELAAVLYETNVLGFKGPRKMTVIIPGIYEPSTQNTSSQFRRTVIQPVDEKDTLLERYKRTRTEVERMNAQIVVINNKSPIWNEDTQSYVLNFHGRVTQASVKNFQVVHPLDPDYIVMQFGRTSDELFTMDFRYPLSALQAFGIAMTSFHGKLACE